MAPELSDFLRLQEWKLLPDIRTLNFIEELLEENFGYDDCEVMMQPFASTLDEEAFLCLCFGFDEGSPPVVCLSRDGDWQLVAGSPEGLIRRLCLPRMLSFPCDLKTWALRVQRGMGADFPARWEQQHEAFVRWAAEQGLSATPEMHGQLAAGLEPLGAGGAALAGAFGQWMQKMCTGY